MARFAKQRKGGLFFVHMGSLNTERWLSVLLCLYKVCVYTCVCIYVISVSICQSVCLSAHHLSLYPSICRPICLVFLIDSLLSLGKAVLWKMQMPFVKSGPGSGEHGVRRMDSPHRAAGISRRGQDGWRLAM